MRPSPKPVFAVAALVAAVLVAPSAPSRAMDWPTRPVTVLVPFAAGGNTDMMARLGAERLSEKFGKPFIVENRPSAGGAIATGLVAAAKPDGYTMLFAASSMLLLTPQLQRVNFDADKDLVPVTNVGTGGQVLAVRRDLPVKTLGELIAYAKANPGKLNYATAGTQNISQLAPALLFARAGVDLVMIPARGGPQAMSDLMSGQVDVYFSNASELLPHIDDEHIRLLAVATPQRLAVAPELPTVAETFPGFVFSSWNGFIVPSGTPEEIIEAVRSEIAAFVQTPEVSQRLTKLGIVPGGLGKDEIAASFAKDRQMFTDAMKAAHLEMQ
jgi:tripartite-type tricarboxylate transporter receptor subunit TctC